MSKRPGEKCVYDPLVAFMEHYAGAQELRSEAALAADAPVEERLRRRIVDGDRIGLDTDLAEAMKEHAPLDIINRILLDGMKTVGELFGSGQMQLPFVLQSAETMKAAVAWLEPHMDRSAESEKACIVLATVKGDVHDIGKNLVDIILTNNGFRVVNLGIKVPAEAMLAAVQEHGADALGMSGLLVKSTLIMKENLELMKGRGLHLPVILGGAALTRRFVEEDLRPLYGGELRYARDAFDGLRLMEDIAAGNITGPMPVADTDAGRTDAGRIAGPTPVADTSDETLSGMEAKMATTAREESGRKAAPDDGAQRRSAVARGVPVPEAPFLGSRIVTDVALEKVYEYINEAALIRGQWQFRRGKRDEETVQRELDEVVYPRLADLKRQLKRDAVLQPAVVYGYFPCHAEGDDLIIYRPADLDGDALYGTWPFARYDRGELVPWQRFTFPRQEKDRYLCLADYFRSAEEGGPDVCAFHVVTMGQSATDYTASLFAEDRYQDYLYVHGLSVECAEALAEYWHRIIRQELGIAEQDAAEIKRLFSQGYQGSRYSFGYPACPKLEDQAQLFAMLRPERIGIELTEEYQLVPEQSTSAIIVHHPEARYFNVR
ncbi:MAG: vitamin B12 dependent-methionine synthase activation domain-containing protein [Bacteroidota bacterium]|nr:vitamin B12 dependent-methionine synthase activation domain-containing protein [Bacteroidota bacterium]